MSRQAVTQVSDTLLIPFLEADTETESTTILTELISTHAAPIIKDIIKSKLRANLNIQAGGRQSLDAEDMRSEVVLQLVKRLQALKADPNKAIGDFRSYVAVTTYHTCDQFLRQEYPQRWHLKNKLRYILKHRPFFALWQSDDDGWLCGLTAWRDQPQIKRAPLAELSQARRSQQLLDKLRMSGAKEFAGKNPCRLKIEALLLAVFKHAGRPIELDDLVSIVSNLWGISDQIQARKGDDQSNKTSEPVSEARMDAAFEVEIRNDLERAWAEICQLPARQRVALLLNLRDSRGRSALLLIPIVGIATVHQIAEALGMPAEQLAILWNRLPLDDATIAAHLGVTRQQVINLRKSARERLGRRLKSLKQT